MISSGYIFFSPVEVVSLKMTDSLISSNSCRSEKCNFSCIIYSGAGSAPAMHHLEILLLASFKSGIGNLQNTFFNQALSHF